MSDDPPWLSDLLVEVDAAFAVTGADTPRWPDPHPDLAPPAEEEYGRYSDPGRYAVLAARVRAWTDVLTGRGIADARQPGRTTWLGESEGRPRGATVLSPVRPGGLGLALARQSLGGVPFGYDVGVVDAEGPPVLLAAIPHCGCDACDDGSAALLDELDGCVVTVARGGAVHARRGTAYTTRTRDGWEGGSAAGRSWLADPPPGVRRWVGAPWA